eukprot:Skav231673  [mRNA]  locus=scaffold597:177506:179203:+ [translate_table: standard]
MPGKWVGGLGSKASPSKGDFIEGKVYDDEGQDQGTVLLEVKRLYSPGEEGRSILADLVTASDPYYRHWAKSKAGSPSTRDGMYHLCKGDPARCPVGVRSKELVVHVGKWRNWPLDESIRGEAKHFDKEGQAALTAFLKSSPGRRREEAGSGLPWKASGLHLGGAKPGSATEKPKEATAASTPKETCEKAEGRSKSKRSEKIKSLKDQLEALKKQLADEEARDSSRSKSMKKGSPRAGTKRPKEGARGPPVKKKKKANEEAEDDGDGDEGEESEEEYSYYTDEEEEPEEDKKKKKEIAAKAAKAAKKKGDKKGKKKKKKKATKKVRDRGAFGVAPTEDYAEEAESDEESDSEDDSEQSFQKAPRSRSHHLKLVRYAKRHPGRLAARLLRKMESATGFGGAEIKSRTATGKLQAVAHMYYLAIMSPAMRSMWTQRTQRELKVSATLLDLTVLGKIKEVQDILAQRIKALERSVADGNQWKRAKFLELVEQDDVALVDQGEEDMMLKEAEREEKMKGSRPHWDEPWRKEKGKGAWSNDQRKGAQGGGKAKGKTGNPAEKLTGKKDADQ